MAPEEANSLGGARIGLRGRGSGDRLRVSIGPEHVHYLSIRDPAPQHPAFSFTEVLLPGLAEDGELYCTGLAVRPQRHDLARLCPLR
jgi:hypothetical protein